MRRIMTNPSSNPGSTERVIGSMASFLEDIAARGFRASHILDVGANSGAWSLVAAGCFPDAVFTLIEPQKEMAKSLDAFCRQHRGSHWIRAGAGPEAGTLPLTIWPDHAGSSLVPTEEEAESYGKHRREVPVVTIDTVVEQANHGIPELVKLDIQGFEIEALRGATSLMGHTELFILEVSWFRFSTHTPTMHEVIAFMADQGYLPYDLCGFLRRPLDGALGQTDIAFARENGILRASNGW